MTAQKTAAEMAAAMAALWRRHRHNCLHRVAILEHAAGAAREGSLDEESRYAAEQAAHKLAGSLGTFGLDEGSRWSFMAEALLGETPLDLPRYAAVVARIRAVLATAEVDPAQADHSPSPGPVA